MLFFTADEHYWHKRIIIYCRRPFKDREEMNEVLVSNHNSKVGKGDLVIHAGDFCLGTREQAQVIIKRLNGEHIFLTGDHDRWLNKTRQWEARSYKIEDNVVIVSHYCMRTWPKSHYNSWHLYAHSHSRLEPIGKSWDIGVDNNNFYPLSEKEVAEIMAGRPDNPNLVKNRIGK